MKSAERESIETSLICDEPNGFDLGSSLADKKRRTPTLITADTTTSKGKLCVEDAPNSRKLLWPAHSTV
jgi:hypothetical protein